MAVKKMTSLLVSLIFTIIFVKLEGIFLVKLKYFRRRQVDGPQERRKDPGVATILDECWQIPYILSMPRQREGG